MKIDSKTKRDKETLKIYNAPDSWLGRYFFLREWNPWWNTKK